MNNTSDIQQIAVLHGQATADLARGNDTEAMARLEEAAAIIEESAAFEHARAWCKGRAGRRLWPSPAIGLYAVGMALHVAHVKRDLDEMFRTALRSQGVPALAALEDLRTRHQALLATAVPAGYGEVHALAVRATAPWAAAGDDGLPDTADQRTGRQADVTINTLQCAGLAYVEVAKQQMGLDALSRRRRQTASARTHRRGS